MENAKEAVKSSYAKRINELMQKKVTQPASCCSSSSPLDEPETVPQSDCCPPAVSSNKDVSSTPSFGCVYDLPGKANIQKGDIVIDLGSGAGHDVFKAAQLVGSEGRVIGIDFTPDMIAAGMQTVAEKSITNVDFRLSDIENIGVLPDNFADVIISNCVINLTMDKEAVFKEALRILKPGGRLVDADVIAVKSLPSDIVTDPEAWCSCLGGALTEDGYTQSMKNSGFDKINITIFDTFEYKGNEFKNGILEASKP